MKRKNLKRGRHPSPYDWRNRVTGMRVAMGGPPFAEAQEMWLAIHRGLQSAKGVSPAYTMPDGELVEMSIVHIDDAIAPGHRDAYGAWRFEDPKRKWTQAEWDAERAK